jgi:hypothetical protein
MIAENYEPEQLVFLDEAACNRNTTKREYGWAPMQGVMITLYVGLGVYPFHSSILDQPHLCL